MPVKPPKKTYLITWIILELLVGAIYGVSCIRMGAGDVIVPLFLAAVQTLLVLLYFMHLRFSERLIWVIIGGGFLWFAVLVDLTMSDYLTRGYIWWLGYAR
jgi:cytochrome c oxidase subunit IV